MKKKTKVVSRQKSKGCISKKWLKFTALAAVILNLMVGAIILGFSVRNYKEVNIIKSKIKDMTQSPISAIPAGAIRISENVYYVGKNKSSATNPELESYIILHRAKNGSYTSGSSSSSTGNNNFDPHASATTGNTLHSGVTTTDNNYDNTTTTGDSTVNSNRRSTIRSQSRGKYAATDPCYLVYGAGIRWRVTNDLYINPSNQDGLSTSFILSAIGAAVNTWSNAISSVSGGFTPFGNIITFSGTVDTNNPNGKNEIMFGQVQQSGVIAFTRVYGIFSGDIGSRKIQEFDQVYDTVDYSWGDATVDPTVMDLQDICTHEMCHAIGFQDEYDSQCSDVTSYGYATAGETKKRTLEAPDRAGVCYLYGTSRACGGSSIGSNGGGGSNEAANSMMLHPSFIVQTFLLLLITVISDFNFIVHQNVLYK